MKRIFPFNINLCVNVNVFGGAISEPGGSRVYVLLSDGVPKSSVTINGSGENGAIRLKQFIILCLVYTQRALTQHNL